MASTFPSPSILPSSSSSTSSATPLQFSSAGEANSYRLKAIVERLNFIMKVKGTIRFDSSEFFNLCFALARGVDYALTINDVPGVAHRLPFLMKEVYQRRKDISLQPAIMVLMISVKNACKNGWFISADADELLSMTNELFNSFCMTISATPQLGNALDIVLKLASRFYPELKLGSLLVSLEAKPGYEILMSDFQIPRNIPPEEKIRLIVVKTDNLETSSCIISPPQVSFMVNGKGVDRRTNVSQDGGPQFPTDITKMLKYGTNIVQAVGYFSGTYLIALAFMTKIVPFPAPILQDYVQPVVSAVGSDSEIIEGASRITLNCPISFRRIKTPVKGHLCKHHQCFDYDNFMEMNSRRPSWRCPFCNQPVSFIDLRIDQNMIKILKEVGEDVVDVIISAEGSWRAAIEPNGSKDQLPREKLKGQQYCSIIESASARSFANTLADPVDLTVGEEDGKSDVAVSPNQVESINDAVSRSDNHSCEVEDTKPFKDAHYFHVQKFFAERPLANNPSMTTQPPLSSQLGNVSWPRVSSSSSSSSSSLPSSYAFSRLLLAQTAPDACVVGNAETTVLPASLENSLAIVNAVSPVRAPNEEDLTNPEPSETNFTFQQLSQDVLLAENMQLEARIGNSIISQEIERLPIPRHVNRNPIAVQALPVQLQSQSQSQPEPEPEPLNSFKRMRINGPNTVPMISNDLSSATYKTIQSVASIPDAHIFATDSEMQVLRTSGQSMSQNMDHQHIQSLPPSAATAAAVATSTTSVASSSFLQRGVGAYRAAAATAAALHQSPSSSLPQPSEHHRNVSTLGRNHHASLISTYRSKTALPLGATRELARQVSHQRVRMQQGNGGGGVAGTVPVSSASQPSTPPPPGVAASELTADQNWRPTGRMRGSLTGSAYSAALSHYLAAPTTQRSQPTPAPRPSISPLDTVTTSRQHNDDMSSQLGTGGAIPK